MAEFGIGLVNFAPVNEDINTYVEGTEAVKAPVLDDISNPPDGFLFVEGGVYFDRSTSKLYIANTVGDIEEVTSAPPGMGGGTITGGTNVGTGGGVFKQVVGGVTMEFKSIIGSDGITVTPNTDDLTLTIDSAPALRFDATGGGDVNYAIPNNPTVNQVLSWNGTALVWKTDDTGGGSGLPFDHNQTHFVDTVNSKNLVFSLDGQDSASTLTLDMPSGVTTGTIVTNDATQVLENKTITSTDNNLDVAVADISGTLPVASGGTGVTTLATGALLGSADTETFTNKVIDGVTPLANNTITIDASSITNGTLSIARGGTGTGSLPAGILIGDGTNVITATANPAGGLVGVTENQTLQNKIIDGTSGGNNTISINLGSISGATASNVLEVDGSGDVVSSRAAPSGQFVGTTGAQTLESKTLGAAGVGNNCTLGANLDAGNTNTIINLPDPTADAHAATKKYVDDNVEAIAAGLDPKESVRVATVNALSSGTYSAAGGASANGSFTGAPATIDGIALNDGDRVLVKDQADPVQNGIYEVLTALSGDWQRAVDHDNSPNGEVSSGNYTFVEEGTENASRGYVLLGSGILVLNTDDLNWGLFSFPGQITAGDGLILSGGTTLDVVAGASGLIAVNADDIELTSAGSAASGIPLVSSGTPGSAPSYQALSLASNDAVTGTLSVANGGTGTITLASGELLTGNGTGAVTTTAIPAGGLVGVSATQDLSNKTLIAPRIQDNGANDYIFTPAGDLTTSRIINLPDESEFDTTSTIVLDDGNQELTNKTIDGTENTITNVSLSAGITGTLGVANGGTGATTLANGELLTGAGAGAVTTTAIPAGGLVGVSATQTLTNKTMDGGSNTFTNININTSTTGTLSVENGGTGSASLTSGNVLVGTGTSAVTTTKAAPTGDFVGTSDNQTLTNKTLDDATNTVSADKLFVGINSLDIPTGPNDGDFLSYSTTGPALAWTTPAVASAPDILANTSKILNGIDPLLTDRTIFVTSGNIDFTDVPNLIPNTITNTIDGADLADGDLIIVKDQTDPTENGVFDFISIRTPATQRTTRTGYTDYKRGQIFKVTSDSFIGLNESLYFIEGDESDGAITIGVDDINISLCLLAPSDSAQLRLVNNTSLIAPGNGGSSVNSTDRNILLGSGVGNGADVETSVMIGHSISGILGTKTIRSSVMLGLGVALTVPNPAADIENCIFIGSFSGLGALENQAGSELMFFGANCNDDMLTYDSGDPTTKITVTDGDIYMVNSDGVTNRRPVIHAQSTAATANWSPGRDDADLGVNVRSWRGLYIQDGITGGTGIDFVNRTTGALTSSIDSSGTSGMYNYVRYEHVINSPAIDDTGSYYLQFATARDTASGITIADTTNPGFNNNQTFTTFRNESGSTRRWLINFEAYLVPTTGTSTFFACNLRCEMVDATTSTTLLPDSAPFGEVIINGGGQSANTGFNDGIPRPRVVSSCVIDVPNNNYIRIRALCDTNSGSWFVESSTARPSRITISELPM